MNTKKFIVFLIILLTLIAICIPFVLNKKEKEIDSADSLILLIPEINVDQTLLEGWKNAASEEGLHLKIMKDSEFQRLHSFPSNKYAGIIMPDGIHKIANPALIHD